MKVGRGTQLLILPAYFSFVHLVLHFSTGAFSSALAQMILRAGFSMFILLLAFV